MDDEGVVFVVDDDDALRGALVLLVESAGMRARGFASADAFLREVGTDAAGCLVTDMRMPGLSGLELQQRLVADGSVLPVIVLTGHGDVPAAVQALKAGAVDFLQKPFAPERLIECVRGALERGCAERARRVLFDTLTARERDVLAMLMEGGANKVIAIDLGISERTVELHRARLMKKLGVRTVAELMKLAMAAGLTAGA
ncbi:response regulator [Hydrogenophaga sp.]|uniref:response regulator transcription factor n=1 Tax=Hydrogenophaga sp. TaxID=1904254 RepID=UPI002621C1B4|nr:response regulator [Hydrogenophaga sp.]MCW5655948.1 response regulator transcription factor [Hydrogenophaga sp.]